MVRPPDRSGARRALLAAAEGGDGGEEEDKNEERLIEGEAAPRGGVFLGTGTGPDAAYSISFSSSNNSIDVTLTPTGSEDLALIVYTNVCSSSPPACRKAFNR